MAEKEGLFGASMRLSLRARFARAKTFPMFLSNLGSHPNLLTPHIKKPPQGRLFYMAEKEGFEPSIPIKVYSLSRGAPSATRPLLRIFYRLVITNLSNLFGRRCFLGSALLRAPALRLLGHHYRDVQNRSRRFSRPLENFSVFLYARNNEPI